MSDSSSTDSDSPQSLYRTLRDGWSRLRERWWTRWTVDLAILGLVFFAITSYQTRNLVDGGERIPEMHLQTADGEAAPIVDPTADRTLVYFWAPWCGVCSVESDTVGWARSLLGDDVAVRSVVFDYEDPAHARRSAAESGLDVPVLLGDRRVLDRYNIDAFPTFYVLSRDGRVLHSTKGYTTTLGLLWRSWW